MKKNWPPNMPDRKAVFQIVLILLIALLALLAVIYGVGRRLESGGSPLEPRGDLSVRFTQAPATAYQGAWYRPKTKLTTLLVMGIDHYSAAAASVSGYRNGGQSDYLLLIVINEESGTLTPIQIDRDTMAEISILGILGNDTGTRTAQICLSHGFGDGQAQSCLLTQKAVSRLLLGVPVDFYIAMNLDGISALNDALGGVTVTLADDFTSLDPAMALGATLTLRGKQAEYFVRNRLNIGIGTNESRMVRQQVYMDGLSGQLQARMAADGSANVVGDLFDQLQPYLLTDMKRGRLINEVWRTRDYAHAATVHPKGVYTVGSDGFVEFHPDEAALEALVIQTFYDEVSLTPAS